MPDAEVLFAAHVKLVREHVGLSLSEADTRAYLVDPVLRILGYETVGDLRREVSDPATKESLDYALLVDGKPHVIVEAKPVQQGVADQHAAQCVQYAAVLGVRWCLVTNGRRSGYSSHSEQCCASGAPCCNSGTEKGRETSSAVRAY